MIVFLLACVLLADFADAYSQLSKPPTDAYVSVNGVRLHYRTLGEGPPLILLHGLGVTGEWWDPIVQKFSSDYTLIIPDLRGHGKSTNPSGKYLHSDLAVDIFGLMDSLHYSKFKAIGHSSGAMTLYHMAISQPDRIEAMIVIGMNYRVTPATLKEYGEYPTLEELPAAVREYLISLHPGGANQVRIHLGYMRALGQNGVTEMNFSTAQITKIKARTLIVMGDRDSHPVEITVEAYRNIPRAEIWIVPNQGHFPFWPQWGGSVEAGSIFPDVARKFLAGS
jgi:pimeloyl-ACP methyl ester carboxylesterase